MSGKKLGDAGAEGEPSASDNTPVENENCDGCEEPGVIEDTHKVLDVAEETKPHVAVEKEKMCCCVCQSTENIRRCGKCNLSMYCSKECQTAHYAQHKQW